MTLALREATPADRVAMLDLWVEAWTRLRPEIDFAARRAWLHDRLDALGAAGTRIIVSVDECDRPIGFVTVDPTTRTVDQLVTAVAAQGRGAGAAMVAHAKRRSPGGLTLTVNTFNAGAVRLYEREGFVTVGRGFSDGSGLPVWHMRWSGDAGFEASRPQKGAENLGIADRTEQSSMLVDNQERAALSVP